MDKRIEKGAHQQIKKQIGLKADDKTYIDPEGNIWYNEAGAAVNAGHYTDYLPKTKDKG